MSCHCAEASEKPRAEPKACEVSGTSKRNPAHSSFPRGRPCSQNARTFPWGDPAWRRGAGGLSARGQGSAENRDAACGPRISSCLVKRFFLSSFPAGGRAGVGKTENFSPLAGGCLEASASSNHWRLLRSAQALRGFCGEAAETPGRQAQARGKAAVLREPGPRRVAGDRALSCLLTAREPAHVQRGPAAWPRVGLWLRAGHFPRPLPSFFFFCQPGREHFLFPPAGEMVPCRGFLVWGCPSRPSGQDWSPPGSRCGSL